MKSKNPNAYALGKLSDAKRTQKQREELARKGGIAKASKMRDLQAENAMLRATVDELKCIIRKTHEGM